MAEHAFFFFRHPAYLNRLPAGTIQQISVAKRPSKRTTCASSKGAFSGFPVHDNYADPTALENL